MSAILSIAHICGFGGRNQLWKYVNYEWKVKWFWLAMNEVGNPKEWGKFVQYIIFKLAVDQYGIKILVLTLFYLFKEEKYKGVHIQC